MIYSMTGFASATAELDNGTVNLELRSVNSRYLDLQMRIPDELRAFESALREAISARLTRGKAECRISISTRSTDGSGTRINQPLLLQLAAWDAQIRGVLPDARPMSVHDVLRWMSCSRPCPNSLRPAPAREKN